MNFLPAFIRTKIRNKVFSSFLIVLLLLSVIFAVSYSAIRRLGKASENILQMNYNSIIYAVQMLQETDAIERNALLYHNSGDSLAYHNKIVAQSSFAAWLSKSKDNITEPGEAQILVKIDSLFTLFLYETDQLVSDKNDNSTLIGNRLEDCRADLKQACLNLLETNQKGMINKSRKAAEISKQGSATLLLVFAIVLGLGIALSYGLSRRIVKPIYRLVEVVKSVASGDYSQRVERDSDDELGILIDRFNEMTRKMGEYNDVNLRAILAEQQKIEAIFANINEGVVFIDTEYRIRDVNDQALNALGLTRKDTVGHHFLEVINNERIFSGIKECLETAKVPVFEEKDNVLSVSVKNKLKIWQYFFSPVVSPQAALMGVLFLMQDISELKELDRLKSEFVMIVSHELKTPLTGINMSIDLLKENLGNNLQPRDLELLDVAKEDVLRLRMLVSDLLDLSKIEAGKIDLHFSEVNLYELMLTTSQNFQNQLQDKKIDLTINDSCRKVPKVYGDEDKLLWVFSNLISNALKAVEPGGRISLKAEQNGAFAVISVNDNGKGIPLDQQKRIFEKFVQLPGSDNSSGTGLGLMICREIIRAQGGTIWVDSEPGKGAEFFFTVPIAGEKTESLFGSQSPIV